MVLLAFKIPEGQEVKNFGFTVYDAETGDPVDGDFAITLGGELLVYRKGMTRYLSAEKGKYIIRFTDGRYIRY